MSTSLAFIGYCYTPSSFDGQTARVIDGHSHNSHLATLHDKETNFIYLATDCFYISITIGSQYRTFDVCFIDSFVNRFLTDFLVALTDSLTYLSESFKIIFIRLTYLHLSDNP